MLRAFPGQSVYSVRVTLVIFDQRIALLWH